MLVDVNKPERKIYVSSYKNITGLSYSTKKISFSYSNNTLPNKYKWICDLTN